ncbi:DUF5955 family protein [Streptomyces sp. ST2-7A]|uniref:DUF5955 family protein n=1 Tax=Streptomyces sp. ST2-7A TaxID=2907214 RepID=UPI001F1A0F6E|nr:DUF5955 family protein [Streptomyces sp. ST2-7A]MCE7082055.1 DUF5955 family protein [Streptomyces sp. ST2-7A]
MAASRTEAGCSARVAVGDAHTGREDSGAGGDPRALALRVAVAGMRAALAGHRAPLTDRGAAERELDRLEITARSPRPHPDELGHGLLMVVGAVGSVRALAVPVAELRAAVELFGARRGPGPATRRSAGWGPTGPVGPDPSRPGRGAAAPG